jgi:Mn2+/Fe2+ NRAMP family transporter
VLSNIISFFIVVTCAATLWASHFQVGPSFSAKDAATALQPLAGDWAQRLFALGLVNAAMIGAVVVPLSTAYAVTESLGWESGLGRRIREAPLFIGIYSAVIVIAAGIILIPHMPLFRIILISQVINGILLPVVLVLMLILINKRRLMGEYVNSRTYNFIAWATVCVVAVLSVVYLGMTVL